MPLTPEVWLHPHNKDYDKDNQKKSESQANIKIISASLLYHSDKIIRDTKIIKQAIHPLLYILSNF